MYQLQKYGGRKSRHTCPGCGRSRCFALYVNENGKALHPSVGRCDHESKCGYHYKPKDFFSDHPNLVPPESWRKPMEQEERKEWFICESEVRRFFSTESSLLLFLKTIFPAESVNQVAYQYQLGSLIDRSTIFWQIDSAGRVRTGKVMAYGEDGHRIKNPDNDRITWMHTLLKKDKVIPQEFDINQCLFGEHLLSSRPDAPVALVESEKTAVIMSMVNPDFVWVATGGKNNLKAELLNALKNRKVFLYPDADAIAEWQEKADRLGPWYDLKVCDLNYTEEDIEHKRDIADITIKTIKKSLQ